MRFDHRAYEGIILIGASRAKGLWANQLQVLGSPVTRNGGRLSSTATNHSLLTIALVSGLRSITNKMSADLVSKRRNGRNKPSLLIKSIDPTFLPALTSAMQKQPGPTLRAIRSLHQPLAKQLSRFKLVLEREEQNPAILAALDWAEHNVLPPAGINDVSPVLLPAAVNVREQSRRN